MRLRFSLRALFVAIALVGICLGVGQLFGVVIGSFFCFLMVVYLASRTLSFSAQKHLAIAAVAFCLVPWFGVSGVNFAYPGAEWRLPTLEPPLLFAIPLQLVYVVAEVPLQVATFWSADLSEFVYFSGSSHVRPFAVFVFWFGILLAIILAASFTKRAV